MSKKEIVEVPQKRISFKGAYVYYITQFYTVKNESKTRTNKSKIIGKLVNVGDRTKMYPNNNYYEIFKIEKYFKKPNEIVNVGASVVLDLIADKLGLKEILEVVFDDKYKHILQIAYFMIIESKVMYFIDDYFDKHLNMFDINIGSKNLMNIYKIIDETSKLEFFRLWKNKIINDGDYVAYDVTSLSTYSEGITIGEFGYNRDKENLPQINVGVLYSQDKDIPICYDIYNGSINDKSFFKSMIEIRKIVDIKNIIYVMDKGFLSKENLLYISDNDIKILISTLSNEKIYKEKLIEKADNIKDIDNMILDLGVYGTSDEIIIDNNRYINHIYYDNAKANVKETEFLNKINKIELELKKGIDKSKSYTSSKYFDIKQEKSTIKSYSIKKDLIRNEHKIQGMYSLLTNDYNLSTDTALKLYRKRNMVESHYDNMKNTLDFTYLNTHNDVSLQGKFFIGFIAQILLDYVVSRMKHFKKEREILSTKKIIGILENIVLLNYDDKNILLKPLTSKQKNIIEGLNLSVDDFMKKLGL